MYFQLEVDYYSNEANKNKYKNIQLIALTNNNLKLATYCAGHCTCHTCCLDFKVICCLGLVFLESIFLELESILLLERYVCYCCLKVMSTRYLSLYINTIYVNKNQHSHLWRLSPSLSFIIHKCRGITLAWAHCSQP